MGVDAFHDSGENVIVEDANTNLRTEQRHVLE